MKAISIRQPWPWLIIRPDIIGNDARNVAYKRGLIKDIENRDWLTHFRGKTLVHAGKSKDQGEWNDAYWALLEAAGEEEAAKLPPFSELECGGIVGQVDILDCVPASASKWFYGDFGFVLINSKPLPFRPLRGQLGFFEVPDLVAA